MSFSLSCSYAQAGNFPAFFSQVHLLQSYNPRENDEDSKLSKDSVTPAGQ